ncbi:hypothetical protein TeGR_g12299, partial [Tetraparma gracilis]
MRSLLPILLPILLGLLLQLSPSLPLSTPPPPPPPPAYASLPIGTPVTVSVNPSLPPLKLWKKRRRSSSPLLHPCTLLALPAGGTLGRNCEWLLNKFGVATPNGVSLSLTKMERHFRTVFEFDPTELCDAITDAVRASEPPASEPPAFKSASPANPGGADASPPPPALYAALSLCSLPPHLSLSPLSLSTTSPPPLCKSLSSYSSSCLTAISLSPRPTPTGSCKRVTPSPAAPHITTPPLSVALRLPPSASPPSRATAYVAGYEPAGDAGNPLLTLSLSPVHTHRPAPAAPRERRGERSPLAGLERGRLLGGRVVRMSERGGYALVDCGVTRRVGGSRGGGTEAVLGMLRFEDMVEGMGEEGEEG